MKNAPIVLIGMMGSGKTTVGQQLAEILGLDWVDVDKELVRRWGPIAAQFRTLGESAFRDRESLLLKELIKGDCKVVSGGGGIVLRASNRELLKKNRTVYLQVPISVLEARLKKGSEQKKRPLLQGKDTPKVLRSIYRERADLYRQSMAFSVQAWHGTPLQVAQRIAQRLKGFSLS